MNITESSLAGTETRYWWGETFDESKCHNSESGLNHTLPPDESRANRWGLIDMLGNVWEWCLDGPRKYDGEPQRDPVGPRGEASARVLRGHYLGFRVAAVPPGAASSKEE